MRVHCAELCRREGDENQQGADDLDELVHRRRAYCAARPDSEDRRDRLEDAGPDVDLDRRGGDQDGDRQGDGEEGRRQ